VARNSLYDRLNKIQPNAMMGKQVDADLRRVTPQNALAMGSMLPGVGDAIGLAGDAYGYATDPSSRTWKNGLLSLAALLPGIPRGLQGEQIDSFKRWFGDSKVVNKAGEPVPMFHGTNADFAEFSKDKVQSRYPYSFGMHFTDRTQEANHYADELGGNIRPTYLNARNPLIIDTKRLTASMEADENRAEIIHQLMEAKKAGKPYDSVIIRRNHGDEYDGMNAIVFDPEQIKSVFGAEF
jgi:hypothetical protein